MSAPAIDGQGPFLPVHARWRIALAEGETQTLSPVGGPSAIAVEPGASGTISVSAQVSQSAQVQPVETGTASYGANTTLALHAPVYALIVSAAGAPGAVSVTW